MALTAFGAIGAKMPTHGMNYYASKVAVWVLVVLLSPQAVLPAICCCARTLPECQCCCERPTQPTDRPCSPCPETCSCERSDSSIPTLPQRHSETGHDWAQSLSGAFLNPAEVQISLPLLADWPVRAISGSERCIAHCRLDL